MAVKKSAATSPTELLIYADYLEDNGDVSQAQLCRAKAYAWLWAYHWQHAVLCYIDKYNKNVAYFTTQDLKEQWGDAPFEHNAGIPYTPCWHRTKQDCWCDICKRDWNPDGSPKWHIITVIFDLDYTYPADNHINSPYTVGTSLVDFCMFMDKYAAYWWPGTVEP